MQHLQERERRARPSGKGGRQALLLKTKGALKPDVAALEAQELTEDRRTLDIKHK